MKCIIGLGNPGPSYCLNRHNVGFIFVDMVAHDYGFSGFKAKDGALLAEGRIGTEKCLLIKPQAYMNKSGISASKIANFYKIPLDDIIVAHDELDLDYTKFRCKTGGGAGGHNGLRSLDAHLGNAYQRLRIGIGHPGHKDKVTGHVLGNFSKDEIDDLPYVLGPMSDGLETWFKEGANAFQTKTAQQIQNTFHPKNS